jgi:hypothetical protein
VNYTLSSNGEVWFYNNETFWRIAEFTGDPSWIRCGEAVAKAMSDKFLTVGPSPVPGNGIFYFPWQLVRAYSSSRDARYRKAINVITGTTASETTTEVAGGLNSRGDMRDLYQREMGFALERWLSKRAITGEENYSLRNLADCAIGILYMNAAGRPERTFNEPWLLNTLVQPLIRYYSIYRDERVPHVIRLFLNKAWNDWWNPGRFQFPYNPEPWGERCYGNNCIDNPVQNFRYPGARLNAYMAPAYAWMFRLSGDTRYRDRHDTMFSRIWEPDAPELPYDGGTSGDPYNAKEWSQVYYWSFAGVEWRMGRTPAY